ncbi:STAS domain-containing protein [Microbispora hainanensis]|uniref:Anti-sigma factor antagonist n=1 Tax=Microbispora hainanensis TaxID=568844 RepID=A0ABZ1SKF5_9ACTN|nr:MULTISPECIES: STAS domain-containing protein [Microbispora]NJP28501.1 STAS domain-containing protein [Microbispora sp. CL1-1]TQS08348.1 STAS domain-containing protein [Microbispora sp. SCL1-1]
MTAAVVLTPVSAPVADHVLVVALDGALDYTNAEPLRRNVEALLGEHHRQLVLDLSGVSFCDSTGIRILLAVRKLLQERDGAVTLAAPNDRLAKIFRVTGLISAFTVAPSLAEAFDVVGARSNPR